MADGFDDETIGDTPAAPIPSSAADVEMGEGGEASTTTPALAAAAAEPSAAGTELSFAEGSEGDGGQRQQEKVPSRVSFLQYLATPIVTLLVGSGENLTILTAHQGLLVRSPYFEAACAEFADDGSPRQIELPDEDVDAVGCFLEFLYTGDYFPRKVPGQRALEKDPSIPDVDLAGDQLLKHARVYTLAGKLGLQSLRSLASNKIHCINSTAKGEIAYARYVYANTTKDDAAVRMPIVNFWATRSHTLRAEAEEEFRDLCLEFPQFGYDVLSRILDDKLRRERNEKMNPAASTPGSTRKRPRHSSTVV
ncbi:hypothetical protein VTJ83DRAFT_2711 [Remersonia thermophila]|uniref:BTB domain-containing protein n=1 Tax=Remersonia thermophila TaxID=72144 RepID=A0ABR4DLT3_9PEZI